MADLVVTFSGARPHEGLSAFEKTFPLAKGADVRTEVLTIGATSVATSIAATSNEFFVELAAGADCWVQIDEAPIATDMSGSPSTGTSRKILSNQRYEFAILTGQKVAVIQQA